MTDGQALLATEGLSVHYWTRSGYVHALDNVTLNVPLGETLGIVGETGSGKSTLGKTILGIVPTKTRVTGRLTYRGTDLGLLPEKEFRQIRGKDIALIFQDPMTRLNPVMRIEDHFLEEIRAHESIPKNEARRRTIEALTSMGIPASRARNYPHEFSGGMRQRIMIAMALVLHPSLLIADEPTTSLDVITEAQILEILEDLKKTYHMSMILITHNLGIVAQVCDRVAVLYAGKIAEIGSVEQIFKHPIHPYTRLLLQSMIHLETKKLRSIEGTPPDLLSPPAACRFHPRCPYAKPICRTEDPALLEYEPGHYSACHFSKDFL